MMATYFYYFFAGLIPSTSVNGDHIILHGGMAWWPMGAFYNCGRILLEWWPHAATKVAVSFYNGDRILLQWWPHISTMLAASFYIGGHIILQWWPHPTTMVA
jgi:hypothetical protein